MQTAATLTVDLAALTANWNTLAARAPASKTAAVVKADAYGLGMVPVATALHTAGCLTFFVAHVGEAKLLRAALPHATIYVLHGITGANPADLGAIHARPVLNSMDDIAAWTKYTAGGGADHGCAIHVDTGMSRLGISRDEYAGLAAAPRGFDLKLVMSHFSDSEVAGSALTARQLAQFNELRPLLPDVPHSLANSSGIYVDGAAFDVTRPGISLYGGNPTPGQRNPMQPVVNLRAPILQQREVPSGTPVGYNATFVTRRTSRLATLAIGYADGWLRSGMGKVQVKIGGRLCPVVGRISMDLIVVDITDLPDLDAARAHEGILLDDTLTIDLVAAEMGTISYELLTRMGPRLNRSYING